MPKRSRGGKQVKGPAAPAGRSRVGPTPMTPGEADAQVQWLTTAGLVVIALITVGLVVYVRLRLASIPLERDEGEYAYAGQLILDGVPPYVLAYNMKFPGVYYAYAAMMAVFGQTVAGIRIGLLCWNLATMGVLFVLGRRLAGNLAAGVGACAFALLALDRWSMGIFAHATHFVLLPAVAGFLVLHVALRSERAWMFVISGFLMGVAIIMKQQALFFALPAVGLAMWSARPAGTTGMLRRGAFVVVGLAAALGLLVGLLATQGVLGRFWFWTFQYAAAYVSEIPVSLGMYVLGVVWARITQDSGWFWYAGFAGILLLFVTRLAQGNRLFIVAWLVASALAIVPGLYFRPHYFILLMPVIGLLAGVAIASLDRLATRPIGPVGARVAALLVCAGILGLYVVRQSPYLFRIGETELIRSLYQENPFLESPEVARYLAAHTTPDDRIVVLGSEPQIYFYAGRKSATGYIYAYPLMEPQPYASQMQDEMRREVEAARPLYLVLLDLPASWGSRPGSDTRILTWAVDYATRCYDRVGVAEMQATGGTRVMWDADQATFQPGKKPLMMTFRRKAGDVCK